MILYLCTKNYDMMSGCGIMVYDGRTDRQTE